MTDSPAESPVLSAAETSVAESLLAEAWGKAVAVRSAETIWGRSHIVRLRLADTGGSVVLKRRRSENFGGRVRGFAAELATLEFLNAEETAVAPRLIGASADLLLMEDLGPGSSLAHALLARDRDRAEADLAAYARALATMHAWSMGRAASFSSVRVRRRCRPGRSGRDRVAEGKQPLLEVAVRLGLSVEGADAEIGSLDGLMHGSGYTGLVHGDPCPDNTHIAGGSCRIFDFETAGWGPLALDASYLLAPFPSCWCFASLPAPAAGPALQAYRDEMSGAGVELDDSWEVALTAVLAGWVVVRGAGIGRALEKDRDWGTTTIRPRVLTWLGSFIDAAARVDELPRLRSLASALRTVLRDRWPSAVAPSYPALARPGEPLARVPREWPSSD
ncbi:MAG: aminoglycoside phosphotransferase family protein [Trebonia sp.]